MRSNNGEPLFLRPILQWKLHIDEELYFVTAFYLDVKQGSHHSS